MDNCKDISYLINSKNFIEFVWGKVPNSPTRHTAIVVKFDGNPEIVIDFSALNPNKSTALRSFHYFQGIKQLALPDHVGPIPSNINVCIFNKEADFDVLGSILKFDIVNKIEKERASCLILDLLRIEMGQYHAKKNNCRAFIRQAMKILGNEPEFTDINRENFENEITALESEDDKKVHTAKVVAGVGLGLGLIAAGAAGLYAHFTEVDGPEPVHENLGHDNENDDQENVRENDDENINADENRDVHKTPHEIVTIEH